MVAIDQTPDEVIIHYQTRVGRFEARGDYAIITVPFPVLRHVEVLKPFSRPKQRAIRQLHYDASAKIFFQTRRRFWEEDEGIYGGAFALFDPGQQTLLHEEIVKPEGRIHFAGEHASLYHAWIQGAFESGLRAAIAIHQSP
jgi:monoamine oxidase